MHTSDYAKPITTIVVCVLLFMVGVAAAEKGTEDAVLTPEPTGPLAVAASAGPFHLLEPLADKSYDAAVAACAAHGWFVGAVTTRNEFEFLWSLLPSRTTDWFWTGIRRKPGTSEFTISSGPKAGTVYSIGLHGPGIDCQQKLCNWDNVFPQLAGDDVHIYGPHGAIRGGKYDLVTPSQVLCQTCVAGSVGCEFPLPAAPARDVVSKSGDFSMLAPVIAPVSVMQRMCEARGETLAYYRTAEEAALVRALTPTAGISFALIDGFEDADGVMRWKYGPLAGEAISREAAAGGGPECLQEYCNFADWSTYEARGEENKLFVSLHDPRFMWLKECETNAMQNIHVICRKPRAPSMGAHASLGRLTRAKWRAAPASRFTVQAKAAANGMSRLLLTATWSRRRTWCCWWCLLPVSLLLSELALPFASTAATSVLKN